MSWTPWRAGWRILVCSVALVVVSAGTADAALIPPLHPPDGLAVDLPPAVSAITWIVYDETYDIVLASEGADVERPMASTTKIMTGIVALENFRPGETTIVSQNADDVGEAEVGLVAGEEIQLGALTRGLLVRSANDAAIAVAEGVGGSVDGFVAMMNAKAAELGLEHTHFANPHGLDAVGHYSSAADLLTMARAAMEIPAFAEAVQSKVYRFPPDPEGLARVVENTNLLLWSYDGAVGVKTGFTFQAGLVLVAAAERDGRRIFVVVMGSEGDNAHFTDGAELLDYGFESFGVVPLVIDGVTYGLQRSGASTSPLLAAATLEAFVHIAGAGVLAPRLTVEHGVPVLVVGTESQEVAIESGPDPSLPGIQDAFGWFTRWLGGDE